MTTTRMTSRAFSHDPGGARKAAESGPVIITHRGEPVHVLVSIAEYRRLTGATRSLVDRLVMPADAGDIDFEPPRLDGALANVAELD
ncbi:MAG: type II toxin-antitoxin system Phd/YefM family antitoxin [Sphingobacteriia bacterium]|nr:type II toxin-antitoxin system Phd/YefM family antitoxin [Sphingobacteriia bacterium]NCC41508.1 type II toxin-antitoxin system Phd/YefM family antitoxin [Gammaproteobacteria bacterium]